MPKQLYPIFKQCKSHINFSYYSRYSIIFYSCSRNSYHVVSCSKISHFESLTVVNSKVADEWLSAEPHPRPSPETLGLGLEFEDWREALAIVGVSLFWGSADHARTYIRRMTLHLGHSDKEYLGVSRSSRPVRRSTAMQSGLAKSHKVP